MQNKPSLDGFVPRRPASAMGEHHARPMGQLPRPVERPIIGQPSRPIQTTDELPKRQVGNSISKSEIDESLAGIDNEEPTKKRRRLFGRRRTKKPVSRRRKIIKRVIIALLILFVLIGGYLGIKAFIASSKVFQGNLFDVFKNQPLKMDANGRSNVLIFGTSEDDPGHEAPYLTDTIMVMSIDQEKKNAYSISIPRDFYVDYGQACVAGFGGKINALYQCYSSDGKDEKAGATALRQKVGEVLGLDVQYYAHVNYSVVRDVVGALGTITVDIESTNPRGIMDNNFDWKCKGGDPYASLETMKKICPPNGHFIDYPIGPAKLDAEHALYLAQARGAGSQTYGLERSNFDREVNQQKIIKAIREKAVSAGTLTNVGAVTGLIDAMGKNLRTNFATSEIRTLMQLGQDIQTEDIQSIPLVPDKKGKGENFLVNQPGTSNLMPATGLTDYAQIQAYIKKKLSSNPVVREGANIAVYNGTNKIGLAKTEADKLTAKGYMVTTTDNAPEGEYGNATIHQLTKGNQGTKAALEELYGVSVSTEKPAFNVVAGTDFVVIIGKVPASESSTQ